MKSILLFFIVLISSSIATAATKSRVQTLSKISQIFQLPVSIENTLKDRIDFKTMLEKKVYVTSTPSIQSFIRTECSLSEAVFESLKTFALKEDNNKVHKSIIKFIKKNTSKKDIALNLKKDSPLYGLPIPKSISIQSVTCFSDASEYILGLVYEEQNGSFYRVDISLDGFN